MGTVLPKGHLGDLLAEMHPQRHLRQSDLGITMEYPSRYFPNELDGSEAGLPDADALCITLSEAVYSALQVLQLGVLSQVHAS